VYLCRKLNRKDATHARLGKLSVSLLLIASVPFEQARNLVAARLRCDVPQMKDNEGCLFN
jgi:hypothetical protein